MASSFAESAAFRIEILEGSGATFPPNRTSPQRLSVKITDEAGQPASGVAVTFRMPSEGATGRFASGFPTELCLTGADGKAAVWGLKWTQGTGPAAVEVTAVRNGVSVAGEIPVEVGATAMASTSHLASSPTGSSRKWLWISLIAAGATGGGLAMLSSSSSAAVKGPVTAPTPVPAVQIGAPTIVIGRP